MHKILILGPQGSGKGTQAKLLGERLGIPALSMGDLLRAEVKSGSELGQKIDSIINEKGELVSNQIVIQVLKKRLSQKDTSNGYILDGFPRNLEQAKAFEPVDSPTEILLIEIPKEESMRRLKRRAKIEKRKDDTTKVIEKRLNVYQNETLPMLKKYEKAGLVRRVDGVGSIDEVSERIKQVIG